MEHLNLLQRIENKSASFSKGQKRLAQYITDNFDQEGILKALYHEKVLNEKDNY